MITDERIADAAAQLDNTLALKLGDLADELLERPATGSDEWVRQWQYLQDHPEERAAHQREWQLVKLQIARKAGVDPTGVVINLRQTGASWADIAEVYGISRQAAYDRWSKHVANYNHYRTETERLAALDAEQIPGQTSIPAHEDDTV